MVPSVLPLLEAYDTGAREQAFHDVLELWRTTRQPRLGALVGVWGRELEPEADAPSRKDAFHACWMERASSGDPRWTGWLARELDRLVALPKGPLDSFRAGYVARRFAVLFERLAALDALPPDPRIAAGLLDVVRRGRFSAGYLDPQTLELYAPILHTLERSADRASAVEMRSLAEQPTARHVTTRAVLTRLLRSAADRCEARSITPVDGLEAVDARLPDDTASRRAAEATLARILEHPDDLGLRAVYADQLQELGDPRGAFIALQLAHTEDADRRARALLRQHKDAWMGPHLSQTFVQAVFQDGFLHAAHLARNAGASKQAWEEGPKDDRLATLRKLSRGSGNLRSYTRFISSPAARALEDVEIDRSAVLLALLGAPRPPPLTTARLGYRPARADLIRFRVLYPGLRSLTLEVTEREGAVDEVWRDLEVTGTLAGLSALRLQHQRYQREWKEAFVPAVLDRFASSGLDVLAAGAERGGYELHRDGTARLLVTHVAMFAEEVPMLLRYLRPGDRMRVRDAEGLLFEEELQRAKRLLEEAGVCVEVQTRGQQLIRAP
ncbi:MAG: TIGR02996 domain-containing protein [Alphaproteobacteria bacterium]|nr:TIGR02996 domain-containing protein [Alphaproteobacteria bacterium]MCB9693432.1 TIGR02996 domain-containing protein [Alphaproteobacteria bacterium]